MINLLMMKAHMRSFTILAVFAVSFFVSSAAQAAVVACPVTDGGAGDDDSTVDGTITINTAETWTMSGGAAGDYWDCTGVDILVTSNTTFTLEGDTSSGAYPYIKTNNLQIDSGSSISGDEKGCEFSSGTDGVIPNGSNVCTSGGSGAATGVTDANGGGGGYGGYGGDGRTTGTQGDYYGDATSPTFFGSSGGSPATAYIAGFGGGVVRIELSGTLTHNGSISVDGGVPANGANFRTAGGGSGGSIYITANDVDGTTGTFSASGGDGRNGTAQDGGGGGGGRIYIEYSTAGTFSFDNSDFDVTGGVGGPGYGEDGDAGTVVVANTTLSAATHYGQFYLDSNSATYDDYFTSWTFDSNMNITCANDTTTFTFVPGTFNLNADVACEVATYTSGTIGASTVFTPASSLSISWTQDTSDLNITLPAGTSVTFTSMTITGPEEGELFIDDAAGLSLVSTTINANVDFQNLTSFSADGSSAINASSKGCKADETVNFENGFGPDGSNNCTVDTAGYSVAATASGGAAHGGAGGAGSGSAGAAGVTTYGSLATPVLFGSSAGGTTDANQQGGPGGGRIRVSTTGDMTLNATLTVDGGVGTTNGTLRASGGGSGGSILIEAQGTLSGSSASFSADGGNGGVGSTIDAGGGGGGRVSVIYGTDSTSYLSGLTAAGVAAGGTADGSATAGSTGTLYTAAYTPPGPEMTAASTNDSDGNGQIDQIIITTDVDVDGTTIAGADFTVTGYTVSSASRTATSQITIALTESGASDSDATPEVTIVGSIADGDGDTTTSGSITPTDGAAPAPIFGAYKDTNGDGTVDRIDVTFSENILYDECEAGDYTVGGADAGSITVSGCANSGDELQLTITNAPSNDTNLTVTLAYTAANGTADSLDDSSGNAAADFPATALADTASPVALSASYTDANSNGQVDRIDVLFTEDIAVDECEAGDYTIGGADAGTISVISCSANGTTMRFGVNNAPGGDTNLALQISYTAANGTASSLDDSTGNAVADFGPLTPTDAALPLLRGISIQDTNNDGLIDKLVIDFSENIDTDDSAPPVLSDFGTITLPDGNTVSNATITDPAGGSNIITLTDVVGQVTQNTEAGSTGIDGITNEWSDGTNLTDNPDENEEIIDDASPLLRTDGSNAPSYQDNDTNGTVDRVKLVFTEAVTISYTDSDWSTFPNDLPSFDVSGISSGNGTSTVYLTATAQANTTGTGGGTEPQLSFTANTGSISDGTNTLNSIFNQTLSDDAAPALRTDGSNEPSYLDNNNDGTIDQVQLTFTEAATLTYNDGDWTATPNNLTSFDVGAYLSGNGTTQILLTASAAANITGVSGATEPTLAFTPSTGSIVDSNGASLSGISATSLSDAASPVSTAYTYKDVNADGTVDRMDISFTESITVNECELADYSLTGADSSGLSYSACNTNSADLQLTITGAPSNDTNLALEFAYNAANGTANSLDDNDSNDVATISTQTATDGARPVLIGFTYSDQDSDAQIDQVDASFTEDVTIVYADGDWSVTANDLSGFDVTGYNSGNGSSTIILAATADPGQTGVSGGTEPTIGFTPVTGSISDGTVTVTSIPDTGVEDNAVMGVLSSAYKDTNTDGQVDRLDVTFSEMPALGECESGDYSFAGDDAGSLAVASCVVSGSDLRLTLNNTPSNDTNLSFTWSYDASAGTASSLEDGNATAAPDYSAQNPSDAAAPLRIFQSYKDTNTDGTVDRFDITFTEDIAYDECEVGDFTIGGADAGGLSISSCATSGSDLQLAVAGTSSNDTFYTLTFAYTAANGTANSLDDAAGNAVGNLSGASLTDEALPVASTISYTDNDSDGQVDRFNVTYTESITLDECETEDWVIGGADAGSIAVVDVTGCVVASPSVTFTISGAPANDTNLTLTLAYANNGTSGSFKDQGNIELSSLNAVAITDAAVPLKLSQIYLDTNNDGQIDRMDVSYTETMTVATCEVADHIFAGADAGTIAISSCTVSGTDVQYPLNNTPTNDTNLTLTYEYDKDAATGNSLTDGSGNVLADYVAGSVSDGASPVLRTDGANAPIYVDADFDGQVDGVTLTFTENTTITYADGDWSVTANDLTGLDVSAIASGNGTSSITLTATANTGITGVDAGTEPTIGYANTTGSIIDGSANERTSISAVSFEDGAAPAAVSQNYKDTNNDGQVDRVDITFSELVEQNECESADFSFGSTDAGSIAVSSCTISSNELRLSISNAPAQDTNLDLTWSYDASNGTANSLDDSDGNGTGDQTAKTLADAAAPLLISSTPANSATDVANDADVVLTFTEPIDTGSLTYSWTNYSDSSTIVWSSGNTVATVTPGNLYDPEANITFEITAADDPTENSMTNTISTHPFSFTVVLYEPDSGSSGALYIERAGQYTSLDIYDSSDLTTPLSTVVPGQRVSIVWAHNGNITMTELYYQTEETNTSSTFIGLVLDGGTQSDWVIPSSTTIGQELTVTAVNAQKVSYKISTSVTVGQEEDEVELEEEEEELENLGQIRTNDSPGVYSTFEDGTRRVFLNSLTYFTWHDGFDDVTTVERSVMSDYFLTGVMLPKAGTVLVKIQSIPNVYYLEESPEDPYKPILRWIPDEEIAIELFGDDWAQSVIDIEPTFFTKFGMSEDPLSVADAEWIDTSLLRTREELTQ